jgi:DNA-binding NarL/FixJ family response regulator
MLDALSDPALLFDLGGELAHANPVATQLTGSVDASRIRTEAQRMAWTLGAGVRRQSRARVVGCSTTLETQTSRELRLGARTYTLRASLIGEHLVGAEPAVLVTIVSATAQPLTDEALEATYGLTMRETQVARLIAEGLSNNEIAERLSVKFFTARNHVERTLGKLGVASRHRVGPLLRNESPDRSEAA